MESPIIPLSPDPFGRFSSTVSTANSSRQPSTYWETNPISSSQFEGVTERRPPSEAKTNSSRFSADSISGGEEVAPAPAKPAGRASNLMNVKSIKNLWRKSAKTAVASQAPQPPAPTLGRNSPQNPPPRPSEEKMSLPPSHSPHTSVGRSSPQLAPPRPAQEFSAPLPPRSTQPSPLAPPRPPHMQNMHMRGDSNFNQLVFDQESPYPTRRSPSVRGSPQPSPAPFLPPTPSLHGTAVVPPPRGSSHMSPPSRSIPTPPLTQEKIPDKEKTGVRKSILKGWKSASGSMSQSQNSISTINSERSSSEKTTSSTSSNSQNGNTRGRRPSVLSFGSGRASVTSPEIPPSPQIPNQFIRAPADQRQSMRSMTQKSSTDSTLYSITQPSRTSSPPRSITSSRDSEETRPSFDASQFEIVSPKMGSSLSYPYHELDHQN